MAAEPAQPEISVKQFIPLVVMMGWNKLAINTDIETEEGALHVNYIRCAFATAVALGCLMYAYCQVTIPMKLKGNTDMVMTQVKEVTAESGMGGVLVNKEVTVLEHDMALIKEEVKKLVMSAAISSFIHLKWGYVHPVLMQSIMVPLAWKDSKILALYILGQSVPPRPWVTKQNSPFEALMPQPEPAAAAETADDGKNNKKKAKKTKKAD